jgi:hypothetical protein
MIPRSIFLLPAALRVMVVKDFLCSFSLSLIGL